MQGLADLASVFGFAVGKGLSPRPNGSAMALLMVGNPFSLRIERDGGQVFVHAGNNSVGWHRLEHVLEFIECALPAAPPDGSPLRPEVLAQLLEAQWDDVTRVFKARQRVSALASFALRRSAVVLHDHFVRPLCLAGGR
jgi:hypothetical protein